MKKTALTVLKIAVSVAIYWYIFTKIDVVHLLDLVKDADFSLLIGAVLVYFLAQGLSAYRWYILLRPLGIETPFTRILAYYFLGMFFNNFFPTAIGGDVFRIYYLKRETGRLSGATASVLLDRDIGMGGLLFVALVVAIITGTSLNGVPLTPIFLAVAVAFLAANLALFYRATYNLLHRLLLLFKMKRADERVEHLFESFNSYRGAWGVTFYAFLVSLVVQAACALLNGMAGLSIGIETQHGWLDYFVFIPAIGLITLLPVSLNGMGLREFAYLVLFGSVGATEAQAAALAFIWLGVIVVTSLPGGLIYVFSRTPKAAPADLVEITEGGEEDEENAKRLEFKSVPDVAETERASSA